VNAKRQKSALGTLERAFTLCFFILFFTLIYAVYVAKRECHLPEKTRSIYVLGAVTQEQAVICSRGATVGDILARVSLKKEAAIEKLALDAIYSDDIFIVPRKSYITVYLKGPSQGLYTFPEGATMGDLYEKLARKGKYKKTRKLKDCEIIALP
jgi:hypothetical protein